VGITNNTDTVEVMRIQSLQQPLDVAICCVLKIFFIRRKHRCRPNITHKQCQWIV